jgi:hypothetical protein
MVLDVVVVVSVPSVAHERVEEVRETCIEDRESFREDPTTVNVLVHHEGVAAHIGELHDDVGDGVR